MLGERYVREEKDEIIIYRIVSIKNETDIVVQDDNGSKFSTTISKLKEDYKLLNPDGFLSFNIVYIDGGLGGRFDDVIVTLHTREDMQSTSKIPTVICRQNINDLHASALKLKSNGTDKDFFGMSISKETCPEDVPFESILSCDGLVKSIPVAVYIDDKFDDIMSIIKHKEFNKILESIFTEHVKKECEGKTLLYNRMIQLQTVDGFVKTLRELLVSNNFMYDFRRTFNILPLKNINISEEIDISNKNTLMMVLSDLLNINIVNIKVIKFAKDIDLTRLAYSYQLVSDESEDIYLVLYEYNSRTIDDINAGLMAKSAYDYLNCDYQKYKEK